MKAMLDASGDLALWYTGEEIVVCDFGSNTEICLLYTSTGLYCGYVDFIAWDIREALNMAKEFFEGTDIPWAIFHTCLLYTSSVQPGSQRHDPGLRKGPQ